MESPVWHSKPRKVLWKASTSLAKYSSSPGLSDIFRSWIWGILERQSELPWCARFPGQLGWRNVIVDGEPEKSKHNWKSSQDLWLEKKKRTKPCTHPLAGPPSWPFPSRRFYLYWKQRGKNPYFQLLYLLGMVTNKYTERGQGDICVKSLPGKQQKTQKLGTEDSWGGSACQTMLAVIIWQQWRRNARRKLLNRQWQHRKAGRWVRTHKTHSNWFVHSGN